MDNRINFVTALLAGGRSSRMGRQNKALFPWYGDVSMIGHLVQRFRRAGEGIVISANDDHDMLNAYGLPLIKDRDADYAGPLAGILAVMDWAVLHQPMSDYIALCSCDTPFVPPDLFEILIEAGEINEGKKSALVLAKSQQHMHPLHGLWSLSLKNELEDYIEAGGRRVQQFSQGFEPVLVPFAPIALANGQKIDPFTNINTPEDYERYRQLSV